MAEATTPVYKFVKPDVGGSKETWGNRLNKDLDDIDAQIALQNSSQWTGLQRGDNTSTVKAYDSGGNVTGTLPLTDIRFRTATNYLTYTDTMVNTLGVNTVYFDPARLGTIVCQKQLYRMLDLLMPVGTIIIWSGTAATIPAGWHLCDAIGYVVIEGGGGATMTIPNLMGRFILAAYHEGYAVPKQNPNDPVSGTAGTFGHTHTSYVTGHTLTPDEIPPHGHGTTAAGTSDAVVARATSGASYYIGGAGGTPAFAQANIADHLPGAANSPGGVDGITAEHTHPFQNVANATPDSPWYALCYIIKIRKWETYY
jgi:hypothetical protein